MQDFTLFGPFCNIFVIFLQEIATPKLEEPNVGFIGMLVIYQSTGIELICIQFAYS